MKFLKDKLYGDMVVMKDDDLSYCYKTCVNTPRGCTQCERISEPYGFDKEKK